MCVLWCCGYSWDRRGWATITNVLSARVLEGRFLGSSAYLGLRTMLLYRYTYVEWDANHVDLLCSNVDEACRFVNEEVGL